MSNADGSFGQSGRDPVTGIFMAMRDAWLAVAPSEGVSGRAMPGGHPQAGSAAATLLGPMIGMLGAMADLAAANRQRFEPPGAAATDQSASVGPSSPVAADLLLPIGSAMMIAANRSVSYWLGLAQIFESHQAKLAQAVGAEAIEGSAQGSERLVAADELRALLREVGDLATREARILQNELSTLDESLAQSFQQPDPSGSHHRRWRTKA
jgi:hypothetical protein